MVRSSFWFVLFFTWNRNQRVIILILSMYVNKILLSLAGFNRIKKKIPNKIFKTRSIVKVNLIFAGFFNICTGFLSNFYQLKMYEVQDRQGVGGVKGEGAWGRKLLSYEGCQRIELCQTFNRFPKFHIFWHLILSLSTKLFFFSYIKKRL